MLVEIAKVCFNIFIAYLNKDLLLFPKFEFTKPGCRQLQVTFELILLLKAYVNNIFNNLDLQYAFHEL